MFQIKPSKPVLFSVVFKRLYALKAIAVVTLISFGFVLTYFLTATPITAQAATNNTLNFQARLETSSGAIVPDGDYGIEFKLYDSPTPGSDTQGTCSGDSHCLWLEDYTGGNTIHVANGYLTVNLGSINPFSNATGTINWGKPLYLSMNIYNSSTSTWDGEMSPRLSLTSVPSAFSLQSPNSGTYTSTLSFVQPTANTQILLPASTNATEYVCYENSANCGFATTSGTLQLQSVSPGSQQVGNFNISGTGLLSTLDATGSGTANTLNIGGVQSSTGTVNLATNVTTGTINVGTSVTSGTINIGGTSQTGTTAIGRSTSTNELDIGVAASSGNTYTQTIKVGTSTNSNSTTNVTLGSTNGASSTTLQSGTGGLSLTTGAGSGTTGSISIASGNSSGGTSGNVTIDTGTNVPSGTQIEDKTFEGGTESMASSWFGTSSVVQSAAQAHGGSDSLAATLSGGNWGVQENYPGAASVTPGHEYHFSAWVRAGSTAQTISGTAAWAGSAASVTWGSATDNSSGWTQISGTAVAPTGATSIYFQFTSNAGTSGEVHYFDDITVTDVSSTTAPLVALGATNAQVVTIGNANQAGVTSLLGGSAGINISTVTNGSINVGSSNDNSINLGTAAVASTLTLGGSGQTGTITLGRSTATNTISIGAANTATGNTQTISIGNGTDAGTGKALVTIGNTNGASALILQAGSAGLTLSDSTGAINLTGGAASTWSIGSGNALTITSSNFNVSGGTTTVGSSSVAGSLVLQNGAGHTVTFTTGTQSNNVALALPNGVSTSDTLCLVTLNNCSGSGVSSVGTYSTSNHYANGAQISSGVLTLGSANGSTPGLIDGSAQSFAGAKTFTSLITASAGATINGGNISLVSAGATTWGIASASAGSNLTLQAGSATGGTNAGGNLILQGGASTGGLGGGVIVKPQTDSTAAFEVQPAAGGTPVLQVDTTHKTVGINTAPDTTGNYDLKVNGAIDSETGIYVQGNAVCTPTSCVPQSGSPNYIQNAVSMQDNANIFIRGVTSAATAKLLAASSLPGDVLDLESSTSVLLDSFGPTGNVLFEPSSNSAAAFQVQNANGYNELSVDTSGNTVTLGNVTTTAGHGVAGQLVFADGSNDNRSLTLKVASLSTSPETITLPDAGGSTATVCYQNASACGFELTTGTDFIKNTTSPQTASFNITNTGVAGALDTNTLDAVSSGGSLNVGASNATTIQLGNTTAATTTLIEGGNTSTALRLQTASGGTINIGTTAQSQTIQIGTTATNTSNTQTIGIGNTNVAGTTNVTIGTGSSATGGNTTVQAKGTLTLTGTGGITETGAAASALTTSSGALTLTSAAAATWSTGAGQLILQGAGGVALQTAGGTASSDITIQTGNASAGNSGNLTLDVGTATGTTGTINIGTSNASSIVLGKSGVTTTIKGGVLYTPSGGFSSGTNNATVTASLLTNNAVVPITATASGLTFNMPTGIGSAGRIVYVTNTGSNSFLLNIGPYTMTFTTSSTATLYWNGSAWSSAGLDAGVTALGAVGSSPNANGATIANNVLTLQPADGTHPGALTAGAQTIGGAKTFSSLITGSAGLTVSGGAATFTDNSSTAFVVNDTSSPAPVLTVDTNSTNNRVIIGAGNAATDANPKFLVLDSSTSSFGNNDPSTVINGAIYYNSADESFRCGESGQWAACDGLAWSVASNTATVSSPNATYKAFGSCGSVLCGTYTPPVDDCQPGVVYDITAYGWYNMGGDTGNWIEFGFYQGAISGGTGGTLISGQKVGGNDSAISTWGDTLSHEWEVNLQVTCVTNGSPDTIMVNGFSLGSDRPVIQFGSGDGGARTGYANWIDGDPFQLRAGFQAAAPDASIGITQFTVVRHGPGS